MKLLITFTLILTTLFSYEIVLGKSSNKDKKVTESKPKIALVRDDSKELVIDKNTGLMWQDNIDAKTIRKNRKDAKQYCRSLVFAGYDDWYLPRLKELKSIVDESKYDPAIKFGFKNIQSYHYWTSSPNLSANIINVINIDFKNGQTYKTNRRGRCNIRCVRGKYNL
ncbi:Lcl C-terminal domain-containing protein [Sulfurimonas gotlandica]|nr:DUF1566 domain-containing protein [Sulfurimonas gotlandica]